MDYTSQKNNNKCKDRRNIKTLNSHQSFSNSDCDYENHKLMIVEDNNSDKSQSSSKIDEEDESGSSSSSTEESLKISNVPNSVSKDKKMKKYFIPSQNNSLKISLTANPINVSDHCGILESRKHAINHLESESKRKRGRPKKSHSIGETKEKRSRGRPRKTSVDLLKLETRDKKPVGRPRINFDTKPKEKRSRGRPRTNLNIVKDLSKEKKSRGRPRKDNNAIISFKEKKPRGRPRSNLKLIKYIGDKTSRKRGRPRKTDQSEIRKSTRIFQSALIKTEASSVEEDDNNSIIYGEVSTTFVETKRKRGRPKKTVPKYKTLSKLDDTSSVDEELSEDVTEEDDDDVKIEMVAK